MNGRVFGIDFGTTNSLAAIADDSGVLALVDEVTQRPHPSAVWYRGSEVVVGRQAKERMDLMESTAPPGFIHSPKTSLRRNGPLFVDGLALDPIDVVAEVIKHLKRDAAMSRGKMHGITLDRAVMTIPVDCGGLERRALRQAARKAGVGIAQFVHEPAAALYAYLRSENGTSSAMTLSRLEGRTVLVFDWGGGTLDLTLCRIEGGAIMQIANRGINDVGGDRFDERLRNLIREKHARRYGLEDVLALEQPGVAAKLLHQCEFVKISLSNANGELEDVLISNYLRIDGAARDLADVVSRRELEEHTSDIIRHGLEAIDVLLEQVGLSHNDIALCLATGGMTKMPAIKNGLTERFVGRVPQIPNSDRIIAEGAAWIAHDGVRLTLSKPLELLVADTSGFGVYHPLVSAGRLLPVENETLSVANLRLYCTDPREGRAMIEIAKPIKPGRTSISDPRRTVAVGYVEVDSAAAPLFERIQCQLQIDHDFVGRVVLTSKALGDLSKFEFYDLEFALSVGPSQERKPKDVGTARKLGENGSRVLKSLATSNVISRTNVALIDDDFRKSRRVVPGDIARLWWPNYFDRQSTDPTPIQREELAFYTECALCHRLPTEFRADGCARCEIPPQKRTTGAVLGGGANSGFDSAVT